ncbi:methyltransferase domain-containing protein [bacterium]|nr:methyltransferase domain-containing protein [bacterium]
MDREYVLEGVLCCSNPECQAQYPILEGIPCILREGYVPGNLSPVDEMIAPHISYLQAHYAEYCNPKLDVSNEIFWQAISGLCHSPGSGMLSIEEKKLAIDLGCATGGFTYKLAEHFSVSVGVDTDFRSLVCAAALQRRGELYFERPVRAMATEETRIMFPAVSNVFFLLSDALDLPFRSGKFGFVSALNLVDIISEPLILLKQMDALLEPGGGLLLTSPFAWKDTTDPEKWLEDTETSPDRMLRQILTGERLRDADFRYTIQAERRNIPWLLPVMKNRLSRYLVYAVRADKSTKDEQEWWCQQP